MPVLLCQVNNLESLSCNVRNNPGHMAWSCNHKVHCRGGGATFVQAAPPALEALSGMAWGLYRRRASCKALQPVYRWQGNLHYSSVGVTSLVGGKAFIFIQEVDLTETLDTAVSMWEFQMYYFLRGASDLGGLWHQRGPWKFWSLTRNLIGGLGNGNVTLCVQVQVVYTLI